MGQKKDGGFMDWFGKGATFITGPNNAPQP